MKSIEILQMEILEHCKIAQEEMDKIILKIQVQLKDLTITRLQRNLLKEDLIRLGHIKRSIRDLEINDYRKDGRLFPNE